jgi:type II secretory pathway pseudopilin PulG
VTPLMKHHPVRRWGRHSCPPSFSPRTIHLPRRAFTLVEVMISVLLVLLVVFGVSQVFTLTSRTIGAGQALAVAGRDSRAFQSTIAEDWRSCIPDSPLVIIGNGTAYATGTDTLNQTTNRDLQLQRGYLGGFKNREEFEADQDSNPFTVDGDGDGRVDPNTQPLDRIVGVFETSDRNPRLDRLAFFAQNRYTLQSIPNGESYVAVTSNEAFIWYGHLGRDIGTNSSAYKQRGVMLTPNNQFAQERILGRATILLNPNAPRKPPDRVDAGGIYPSNKPSPAPANTPDALSPFRTPVRRPIGMLANDIRMAKTDLVRVSLDQIRADLDGLYSTYNPDDRYNDPTKKMWYQDLWDRYEINNSNEVTQPWRFTAHTSITRPLTQEALARTSPVFVNHCTQFIVEYAGDYLYQDPDPTPADIRKTTRGRIVDAPGGRKGIKSYYAAQPGGRFAQEPDYGETDGEIDWIWDRDTQTKSIRWYGMPRDTNNDGQINMKDVVPFWYVINYNETNAIRDPQYDNNRKVPKNSKGAWEVQLRQIPRVIKFENQEDLAKVRFDDGDPSSFHCDSIFHNDAPAMIRITLKIDDPNNRLQNGQWYQFVLTR